jgi:hypothetical protein
MSTACVYAVFTWDRERRCLRLECFKALLFDMGYIRLRLMSYNRLTHTPTLAATKAP